MRVSLLDSLNYNIFDVSTLPLHNSLQTPPKVLSNQRENAGILSKRVKNIGDIFSQSRNRCRSVSIAPVLYIDPEEIVQRTEIGAVWRPAPAPFFLSGKWFEMTRFLKWVSTKSKVRSAVCALAPSCWNQNFEKFFIVLNWGKVFFQYLLINRTVNIFLDENRTNKPLHTERRPYCDFLWMQVHVKNTPGFELAHMWQLCNNYTFTRPLMMRNHRYIFTS